MIAPAGPFNRTLFWRGLGFLAQTFRLRWGDHVFARRGFLAGDEDQRASDLEVALACPETRLIVCARGGVGCADLLGIRHAPMWRVEKMSHPKWLVGFSDVTALHAEWQALGWPSIHASNVTSLGVGCEEVRGRWLAHVLDPWAPRRWELETLQPGTAHGTLIGGNLAVLHDLCASQQWNPPRDSLLFVEDVAEPPYRIYRMLKALERGGHLRRIAGLVVGQVTASHPGIHHTSAREVFAELCAQWQMPAVWGMPCGHELGLNHPITLGIGARLVATSEGAQLTIGAHHSVTREDRRGR